MTLASSTGSDVQEAPEVADDELVVWLQVRDVSVFS